MLDHVAAPPDVVGDASLEIVRIVLDHLALEPLRGACVATKAHHRAQVVVLVVLAVAMGTV